MSDSVRSLVCLFPFLFFGCATSHYLLQAGRGQMELFNKAQPISEVISNPRISRYVRSLLLKVDEIKQFAQDHGLKPTSNYTQYVDLKRDSVVWLVSASEKLRFRSKEWSFPILGSFPYLGWFDEKEAKNYALELEEKENLDVDVHGVQAYSTLGWFQDPLLSTMLTRGEDAFGSLVNVVLHESVHATLFIKDQAFFNESLASFVADQMTLEYLIQKEGKLSKKYLAYVKSEEKRAHLVQSLNQVYQFLKNLYHSNLPTAEKLKTKKES